jgi:hypothetical protein
MAVTARFQADFSSFQDAVAKGGNPVAVASVLGLVVVFVRRLTRPR